MNYYAMYATNRAAVCTVVSVHKEVPHLSVCFFFLLLLILNNPSKKLASWKLCCWENGLFSLCPDHVLSLQQPCFVLSGEHYFTDFLFKNMLSVADNSET